MPPSKRETSRNAARSAEGCAPPNAQRTCELLRACDDRERSCELTLARIRGVLLEDARAVRDVGRARMIVAAIEHQREVSPDSVDQAQRTVLDVRLRAG